MSNSNKAKVLYSGCGIAVLALLLVALVGYLVAGELAGAAEGYYLQNQTCEEFSSGWAVFRGGDVADAAEGRLGAAPSSGESGAAESVDLPRRVSDIGSGERFAVSKELPDIADSSWSLMIWNRGQRVEAYVDGELRYEFTADTSGALSAQVPWEYLFVPLEAGDSGKTITIVASAGTDTDAGNLGEAYVGTEVGEISMLVGKYAPEILFGFYLALMGLLSIIISVAINIRSHRTHPLWLLGVAVCLAALWLVANCRLRQFVFPDAGTIRDVAFLTVAIIPAPFLAYLNRLQEGRYWTLFAVVETLCGANFAATFVLTVAKVFTPSEMFASSIVLIGISVVAAVATLVVDDHRRKLDHYRLVFTGLLVFAVCAVVQVATYALTDTNIVSGLIFMAGMIVLVVCCVYDALRTLVETRVEREKAVEAAQRLTIEALESLAATVDANDRYTSGHSQRVAKYSVEIGRRLRYDDHALNELYYKALLHDVGKIGVSNDIINKEGKLTPEEYESIKAHTTIGDGILCNFTEIPNIREGARWHHERWDGTGYPDGLSGKGIPLDARIIATADAYDAMSSFRSYRDALPQEVICDEVEKGRGTQFDPDLADIILAMIGEDADYDMREKR